MHRNHFILLVLLAALTSTACSGLRGVQVGGRSFDAGKLDPQRLAAAKGDADALLKLQEELFWGQGNHAEQVAEVTLGRQYVSPQELFGFFTIWPLDATGHPWQIMDPLTTPDAPYPRVEVPGGGQPFEFNGIATPAHQSQIDYYAEIRELAYKDPGAPLSSFDSDWSIASDLTKCFHVFIDAHQRLPNDPAEAYSWLGVGIVASKEQALLDHYDLEFRRDTGHTLMRIVGMPKSQQFQPLEFNIAIDPLATSGRMHEVPDPSLVATVH